jgi:hypothetical protein
LKYHPDKNKASDAHEKFQKIKTAYDYLKHICVEEESDSDVDNEYQNQEEYFNEFSYEPFNQNDYKYLLYCFFKNLLTIDRDNTIYSKTTRRIITILLSVVIDICEQKTLELIKCMDRTFLKKIIEIMKTYKEILHLNDDFIQEVDNIYNTKQNKNEHLILNPFIDDIFDDNVYKLKYEDETYIIPLWHGELVYDHHGSDLHVECIAALPENIWIDEHNNVHVKLEYKVSELLGHNYIIYDIGKKKFLLWMKDIKLLKKQMVVYNKIGISKINTKNIYDTSKRSDIIIHLSLDI